MTFTARFCADHGCRPDEFEPSVRRICLSPRACPVFALLHHTDFFAADRGLVRAVAGAIAMAEVRPAIDDDWSPPANQTWLRRVVGWRISIQHLRRFATDYVPFALPASGRHPSPLSP